MNGPINRTEADLLSAYRDSLQNDRALLEQLLTAWSDLSPAQRGAICRTADLFASARAWRGPVEDERGGAR